jgi:uncharacterized protein YvpB
MESFKNYLQKHHIIWLPTAVIILAVVLWQGHRSHWSASLSYWSRSFRYHVLHMDQVHGNYVSQLNVKLQRQEHSLSCEIAALKMALSVYNYNVPESDLIAQLQFDPTPRSRTMWGDPNAGFVGSIDGDMGVTGYGVYWDPIAAVGNKYLPTTARRFGSPAEVAAELAAGHPVVAWGYTGAGKHLLWNTPAGKQIDAINGEHARTIGGFDGDVSNPTRFIIYDPIYGELSWTAEQLFRNWAPFNNMGVVVYPKDDDAALLDQIIQTQ